MCLGDGNCTRIPLYTGIGVKLDDQRQQLGLGGLLGQAMTEVRHAELGRQLALAVRIDLAGRVGADQNCSHARSGAALGD